MTVEEEGSDPFELDPKLLEPVKVPGFDWFALIYAVLFVAVLVALCAWGALASGTVKF